MKKILLSLCCLLVISTVSAWAEGGQYLHVQTASGWKVLDLEKVHRLTFISGNMIATDAQNNTLETFDRASLNKMYVDETTGIQSIIADQAKATFCFQNGVATMLTDGKFEAYSLDGPLLVSINAKKGETIDINAISANVVILKSGSFTLKSTLR